MGVCCHDKNSLELIVLICSRLCKQMPPCHDLSSTQTSGNDFIDKRWKMATLMIVQMGYLSVAIRVGVKEIIIYYL